MRVVAYSSSFLAVPLALLVQPVVAFAPPTRGAVATRIDHPYHASTTSTQLSIALQDFLPKISLGGSGEDSAFATPGPYDGSPESLIVQAKRVIQSDFGLTDPSLLGPGFMWIGPLTDEPLATTDYIAAGRFFNLRGAFPDLDYRAHDFRIDEDGVTVRCTCRVTGIMRGELRLRNAVLAPTGAIMKCPPEAVSMTFDRRTGKLTKLCTGFVMDRLVGNTKGTTGVEAASVVAGEKVSDWDMYPPATVLSRIFARPARPVPETTSFLAPFPETVMIQLTKGIISANMASEDPTLLSDDFTFCTPNIGPVRKSEFLSKYAAEEIGGFEPNFSNFRIDPYDPVRIWVDMKPTAPGFVGPPQAMSFTFDDDGFCTRITSRAVIDPSLGNAGGLAGPEGLKYARGEASPGIITRPLPRNLGRIKKRVLGLVTGVGVDEYKAISAVKLPANPFSPPETPASRTVESTPPKPPMAPPRTTPSTPVIKPLKVTKVTMPQTMASPPKPKTTQQFSNPLDSLKEFSISISENILPPPKGRLSPQTPPKPAAKKTRPAPPAPPKAIPKKAQSASEPIDNPLNAFNQFVASASANILPPPVAKRAPSIPMVPRTQQKPALDIAKQQAAAAAAKKKKKAQDDAAAAQKAVADRRKREAEEERKATAERRKQEAESRKAEADQKKQGAASKAAEKLAATKQAEEKRREAMAKAKLAEIKARKVAPAKPPAPSKSPTIPIVNPDALNGLTKAISSATIGILGLGKQELEELPQQDSAPAKKAPPGVPTLKRWRQNSDKSITGIVSGSRGFDDGDRVTTSPIASGTIAPGQVVRTGSGSRYFLS